MIKCDDQQLYVIGKIDFHNAQAYYEQGLPYVLKVKDHPLVINLSQLEHGNTLALAVMIRWLRQTPNAQGLRFTAIPEKMQKIIQACHLTDDILMI